MKEIYLICGSPGIGKTWVCKQLTDKFEYVPHDDFIKGPVTHLMAVSKRAAECDRPIITEVPFSVSQVKEPLEARGFKVNPIFITEAGSTLTQRYQDRDKKRIPQQHLTRNETYKKRSVEWGCFNGTSEEVLHHLRSL